MAKTSKIAALTLVFAWLILAISAQASENRGIQGLSDADISCELAVAAAKYRIPVVLVDAIAWKESRWRQWDEHGALLGAGSDHVGVLGVFTAGRKDVDRLGNDWRYNIDQGARQLQMCWFRAPIIGNGHLEDGRDILESWYFAIGRYGGSEQSPESNRFADAVLDVVASGGDCRWTPVKVSRLSDADAASGANIFCPPVPWHFGGVADRPLASTVVSLDVPYLSQVYDSPDDFNGGSSCGPTSMVMVLAYYKKIEPKPILIADSYIHTSKFGGQIPVLTSVVCMPKLGAVHAKMLDYLRPMFSGVSIYYNEKATYERVRAELDAGRPCIIGAEVTSSGHIMVVRGYLSDGRLVVNDPAGDYYQVGRKRGPSSPYAGGARRYCNGDGAKAIYDWDALAVRWVMTFGPADSGSDPPEDR